MTPPRSPSDPKGRAGGASKSQKEGGLGRGARPPLHLQRGRQVSKGLARACESRSRTPLRSPSDPKGRAGGAPKVPEGGGFRKGGPAPPCIFSRVPGLPHGAPQSRRDAPEAPRKSQKEGGL